MKGKGSKEVARTLNELIHDIQRIYSYESNQDTVNLSNEELKPMKDNNIIYISTNDNNHNMLGIINRFMRTIKDMIVENKCIKEEVIAPHNSLEYRAPNDIKKTDNKNYEKCKAKYSPYNFKPNDRVKIIYAKEHSFFNLKSTSKRVGS